MLKEIMKIKLHIFSKLHSVVNYSSMYLILKLTVLILDSRVVIFTSVKQFFSLCI